MTQELELADAAEELGVPAPTLPEPEGYGEMDLLWRTCQRLCVQGNEIVPRQYWGRPEAALAAILMGRELGLHDMVSLQKIYVVTGKVVLSADLIRGLIRRAGHSLVYDERTDTVCTMTGKRRDNGDTLTVTWTIEQARAAGLAGKDNWKNYPRAMLDARATTELARALFSDGIGWASYAPQDFDEMGGDGD